MRVETLLVVTVLVVVVTVIIVMTWLRPIPPPVPLYASMKSKVTRRPAYEVSAGLSPAKQIASKNMLSTALVELQIQVLVKTSRTAIPRKELLSVRPLTVATDPVTEGIAPVPPWV